MRTLKLSLILLTLAIFLGTSSAAIFSQGTEDDLTQKKQEIDQIQQEINRLQGEKQTLSSTIAYLNSKIKLTGVQISQTEAELRQVQEQIKDLTGKIVVIDASLADLTDQLLSRVRQTYKQSRVNPFFSLLTSSDSFALMIDRLKYLQIAQKKNHQLVTQLETTRTDYDQQKAQKEEKEQELDALTAKLEAQRASLAIQQQDKKNLLDVTKNDEKRYQAELAQKLAELEAIQSIIAGKGQESQVKTIAQGDTIASIIPGSSPCSSGGHLHFEVVVGGGHRNPAEYLTYKDVVWNNQPDGSFGFNGSWPWPLNDPVRITQGYGMTFYASVLRYYGGSPHTGLDMVNSDYQVKAVQPGTLYRGAIGCGGGTLRYVHVKHTDGGADTYYLHVNY